MELKCRYLGFDISASIDDDNNLISISVNGQTYDMAYIEAIGHMAVSYTHLDVYKRQRHFQT